LEQELRAKEEYLLTAIEEMQTSNEELQSANEELQSANEELETSKEELQSMNEELNTVNGELQSKVMDLARANNDMNNLLAGTGVGTVFLDAQIRIVRFTPGASQVINLIPADIGRPLAHMVTNLVNYDRLVPDARAVLETLSPLEAEVKTKEGIWYLLRIRPYRTLDNVIEGIVLTFVDITARKRSEDELRRMAVIIQDSNDAITVQDLHGRILAWNRGAQRMYGWSEAQAVGMNIMESVPESKRAEIEDFMRRLRAGEQIDSFDTQRKTKDGRILDVWLTVTRLLDDAQAITSIATTERAAGGRIQRN
jgi:two-component system, chemotaxis family, CheB/CheR fusion protein